MKNLSRYLLAVFFGLLIIYPQMPGLSQPAILYPAPVKVDSAIAMNESIKKRNDSASLAIAKETLTKDVPELIAARKPRKPRIERIYITKEVLASDQRIALRINGDMYEVNPEIYKGYLVIDVDSIQREMKKDEYIQDPLIDTLVEVANEKISGWQKFKRFFKRKK